LQELDAARYPAQEKVKILALAWPGLDAAGRYSLRYPRSAAVVRLPARPVGSALSLFSKKQDINRSFQELVCLVLRQCSLGDSNGLAPST
jgi:hypothetical protein